MLGAALVAEVCRSHDLLAVSDEAHERCASHDLPPASSDLLRSPPALVRPRPTSHHLARCTSTASSPARARRTCPSRRPRACASARSQSARAASSSASPAGASRGRAPRTHARLPLAPSPPRAGAITPAPARLRRPTSRRPLHAPGGRYGPAALVGPLSASHTHLTFNAPTPLQAGVAAALRAEDGLEATGGSFGAGARVEGSGQRPGLRPALPHWRPSGAPPGRLGPRPASGHSANDACAGCPAIGHRGH